MKPLFVPLGDDAQQPSHDGFRSTSRSFAPNDKKLSNLSHGRVHGAIAFEGNEPGSTASPFLEAATAE
jgi:hypothetical protein